MFIVHQDSKGKPNTQLQMYRSGLQYCDTRDEDSTFVNNVSNNK